MIHCISNPCMKARIRILHGISDIISWLFSITHIYHVYFTSRNRNIDFQLSNCNIYIFHLNRTLYTSFFVCNWVKRAKRYNQRRWTIIRLSRIIRRNNRYLVHVLAIRKRKCDVKDTTLYHPIMSKKYLAIAANTLFYHIYL